jgi:acetyl esterase/lipase
MTPTLCLIAAVAVAAEPPPLEVKRDVRYADPAHERQVLDVYAPKGAAGRPVVVWVHGGGWQAGNKADVRLKPRAFADRGFVFVAPNYRLLPAADMGDIVRDVARAVGWAHRHAAEVGGDPGRLLVMGHSAGAQLAALVCTDRRYLAAEGVPAAAVRGCVPVDGDTFDVPAIIAVAEARWRAHGLPPARYGHRQKFGDDPARHHDLSAVTHVAAGKGIPPFLVLHVAEHPDTAAQARRLADVLTAAGVPATVFAARDTTHGRIDADLGRPDDPATRAVFAFADQVVKGPAQ